MLVAVSKGMRLTCILAVCMITSLPTKSVFQRYYSEKHLSEVYPYLQDDIVAVRSLWMCEKFNFKNKNSP